MPVKVVDITKIKKFSSDVVTHDLNDLYKSQLGLLDNEKYVRKQNQDDIKELVDYRLFVRDIKDTIDDQIRSYNDYVTSNGSYIQVRGLGELVFYKSNEDTVHDSFKCPLSYWIDTVRFRDLKDTYNSGYGDRINSKVIMEVISVINVVSNFRKPSEDQHVLMSKNFTTAINCLAMYLMTRESTINDLLIMPSLSIMMRVLESDSQSLYHTNEKSKSMVIEEAPFSVHIPKGEHADRIIHLFDKYFRVLYGPEYYKRFTRAIILVQAS